MQFKVLVRSRPDRSNLVLYYIDPDTNREVSKSAGTSDRRQAERAAAAWERELAETRGADNTAWDHFRNRFDAEHLAGLPPKTRKCYTTALNAFRKRVKVELASAIDTSKLSIFQAGLLADGYPVATVRSYLSHLRAALNWAARVGILHAAPHVPMPKQGKRKLTRGRPLTEDEYKAMREFADAPMQRFLDLLWLSGLRLEEARRLSWDRPPIYVSLDAKPHPQIVYLGEGHKSGHDTATPIPPDFDAWLRKTPKAKRHGLVAPVKGSNTVVSTLITAIGHSAGVVVSETARKGRESPVKYASAHDFRRAFGTRWASKVRPLTLKTMMRHESLETTMRYYIGLTGADAGAELWGEGSKG